jgi:hypothetical protein
MNELSIIKQASTLTEIRVLAQKQGQEDVSLLNAADLLITIKKLEEYLKAYKDAVKFEGIDELEQVTETDNFRIAKGVTTRYDYSNNPSWVELSDKIKAHEAFLKSLKSPLHELNDETGVLTTYYPPVKRQSDRLTITEK